MNRHELVIDVKFLVEPFIFFLKKANWGPLSLIRIFERAYLENMCILKILMDWNSMVDTRFLASIQLEKLLIPTMIIIFLILY